MTIRYKVLTHDLVSPYQEYQYALGRTYRIDDFDPSPVIACSRGFYATGIDGVPYTWRGEHRHCIVECEVGGEAVEIDQYKMRYEQITPIKILSREGIITRAQKKEPDIGYRLSEVIYPIDPRTIPIPDITEDHTALLSTWASIWDAIGAPVNTSVGDAIGASVGDSVRDSVGDSVGDSVWASVWASIGASVRASVGASVRASVWASVGAYIGSLFPEIHEWYYIDHAPGVYPFQPAADLWRQGLIPSYDGNRWRLHAGPEMEVMYED